MKWRWLHNLNGEKASATGDEGRNMHVSLTQKDCLDLNQLVNIESQCGCCRTAALPKIGISCRTSYGSKSS